MAERRASVTGHMQWEYWPGTGGITAKVKRVEVFWVVNAECSYLVIRSGELVCNQWLGGTPALGMLSTVLNSCIYEYFHPAVRSPEKPRWSRQHIHDSGKFSAHGCHACEISCGGSTRQEITYAHNSCKKLCVWVGGHVFVLQVKCIAKNTLPKTNTYGLVALQTKNMLYVFFWVIPRRLNFICRRFGTLCSIFLGK
jgi:hypothetical protein